LTVKIARPCVAETFPKMCSTVNQTVDDFSELVGQRRSVDAPKVFRLFHDELASPIIEEAAEFRFPTSQWTWGNAESILAVLTVENARLGIVHHRAEGGHDKINPPVMAHGCRGTRSQQPERGLIE